MYKNTNKTRIEWIDFAKGVTILLVIVGHTVQQGKNGSVLRALITSFHMPLFFILSGVTFRCSNSIEEFCAKTKKTFRHLIGPALFLLGLILLNEVIRNPQLISDLQWWKNKLYMFIFASGVETVFNGFHVDLLGISWFFYAIFLGRTMFDYIQLQFTEGQLAVVSIGTGVLGICISSYQWLPFSLDIALAVMPFFYFGFLAKKIDMEKDAVKKLFLWMVIWLFTLAITFTDYDNWTYLELAARRYNFFPICYLTAIAGTMFVGEFGVLCCRYLKHIKKPFLYLGKNSLYLLCVHVMDYLTFPIWNLENHQFWCAARRILANLIVFMLLMIVMRIWKELKKHLPVTNR